MFMGPGLSCNEKRVMEVLGRRSQLQRQAISECYKQEYGESLHKRLKSAISNGKLAKCISLWTMEPSERDAVLLYEALREGGPRKDRAVIGMLCTRTAPQIYEIKQAYYSLFNQTLESHIDGTGFEGFSESSSKVSGTLSQHVYSPLRGCFFSVFVKNVMFDFFFNAKLVYHI